MQEKTYETLSNVNMVIAGATLVGAVAVWGRGRMSRNRLALADGLFMGIVAAGLYGMSNAWATRAIERAEHRRLADSATLAKYDALEGGGVSQSRGALSHMKQAATL